MIRSNTPLSTTASKTLNRHVQDNRPIVLDAAAGLTLTLPAATGSGARFHAVVGTLLTSNDYIIAVTGNDTFFGGVFINDTGDTTPATVDLYPAASGNNKITLAQSAGAGKIGDWVEVIDIATDKWAVRGILSGELDPASPFSTV